MVTLLKSISSRETHHSRPDAKSATKHLKEPDSYPPKTALDDKTIAIESNPKEESYPEEDLTEIEFECEICGHRFSTSKKATQ